MPDGSTYVGIHTTPIDETTRNPLKPGAINGGIMLKNDKVAMPVLAIPRPVNRRTREADRSGGGSIVMPKVDMMGMGFYAYFKDPSGTSWGCGRMRRNSEQW
jgi:predicted enzyme related to lactoylglutathione lyase